MFVVCFISQRMKRSKHGVFVFPPKKTLMWRGIVLLANRVAVWRQSEVSVDFYKVHGHELFSPERSLNLPKATRVCICSINQSNRSIFVRLLFLFCSNVFISRSYQNRSMKLDVGEEICSINCWWALSVYVWIYVNFVTQIF